MSRYFILGNDDRLAVGNVKLESAESLARTWNKHGLHKPYRILDEEEWEQHKRDMVHR